MTTIAFENPANGHVRKIQSPLLGCFILGPLYLLLAGAFIPAAIYFAAGFLTGGLAWLVLPFWAETMVRNYYLGAGWTEVHFPKADRTAKQVRDIKWSETTVIVAGMALMTVACIGFVVVLRFL